MVSGTLSSFKVSLSAAPGSSAGYTFTLRVNQVSSVLSCTIQNSTSLRNCSSTNTVTLADGDLIDVLVTVPNGSPATTRVAWTAAFAPS